MVVRLLGLTLQFITGWVLAFLGLALTVSLLMGAMQLAAWFAFLGAPPEFPWFIWRLFVALSAMISLIGGYLALDDGSGKEVV